MNINDMLVRQALEAGAKAAFVLPVDELVFDAGLRKYCEVNRCGSYDRNYACPPCIGTAEEVIAKAKQYEWALIFQTVGQLEDSYDFEGMAEAKKHHNALSDRLFDDIRKELPKCLPLSAGGCSVCETCARTDNLPCRFPEKAISSMEGYCMNVSQIAEKCGMKYINGVNTVTYFSAVLF